MIWFKLDLLVVMTVIDVDVRFEVAERA